MTDVCEKLRVVAKKMQHVANNVVLRVEFFDFLYGGKIILCLLRDKDCTQI